MTARAYDVIVIGAGPTGENAAGRAVRGGLSAVIVESELVGGECSYWACMPSKALLRGPQAVSAARTVDGARQAATGTLDVAATLARRDRFASHWKDDGQVAWLDATHIDLVRGHGRLAGERRVAVTAADGTVVDLAARHAVVIATGTRAAMPPIPGIADVRPWTSREATSAKAAPQRLVIVGGGVVACEMATAWRALGSREVTVVQRGPRLVPGVEAFAGEMLAAAFGERGIAVRLNAEATRAARRADGSVAADLTDGTTVVADEILIAAGRAPNTDDIGLDTIGLRPGSWLDVDASLRVPAVAGGWLYAAGDVNHRALLTHMGKYQARVCGDVIAARATGKSDTSATAWSAHADSADAAAVPQVIFTEPEIAAVGLTEEQARARGLRVRAVDYDIGAVAGARLYADGYAGRARMVVDEDRRVIVGVTLVGPAVGEQIHAATIAVVGEVPLERLWHAVPSYPTIGELWLRLLETYGL